MRYLLILFFAVVLPVLVIMTLTQPSQEMPVEWELAVVNAEAKVRANDPTVLEFRRLLDRLEKKSSSPRREIAELCIAAHSLRKRRGSPETLLEFTTDVDEAIPDYLPHEANLKEVVREVLANKP